VTLPYGELFSTNRGKVIGQGFDFQMVALLTEDLKVAAMADYTNAYGPNATNGGANSDIPTLQTGGGAEVLYILP
jgi:hypothetical protein